jgi:hypothetical protein
MLTCMQRRSKPAKAPGGLLPMRSQIRHNLVNYPRAYAVSVVASYTRCRSYIFNPSAITNTVSSSAILPTTYNGQPAVLLQEPVRRFPRCSGQRSGRIWFYVMRPTYPRLYEAGRCQDQLFPGSIFLFHRVEGRLSGGDYLAGYVLPIGQSWPTNYLFGHF